MMHFAIKLVSNKYWLASSLLVLWILNFSLFIGYQNTLEMELTNGSKQKLSQKGNEKETGEPCEMLPCPSPYGPNLYENIKLVISRQRNDSPVQEYLRLLGIGEYGLKSLSLSHGLRNDKTSGQMVKETEIDQQYPTIVLAASSNHYLEVQALFYNLHSMLGEAMRIVFFDLGLEHYQKEEMVRHCKCEVRTFPFWKFPEHVSDIKVFSWKPTLLQLALQEFGFIMYMDASIRIQIYDLRDLFTVAWQQGIMVISGDELTYKMVEHTDPRTFAFMEEKPCYFDDVPERQAGFLLMTNVTWLQQAVMRPWLECALAQECIAPQGSKTRWSCSWYRHFYGECHRFDQSVFNIVLSRIYTNNTVPKIPGVFYRVDRNDKMNSFERF